MHIFGFSLIYDILNLLIFHKNIYMYTFKEMIFLLATVQPNSLIPSCQ